MKIGMLVLAGLLCLVLVGGVYATNFIYSEPTRSDGSSIEWEQHNPPIKGECPKNEWNYMFEEYRNGNIPKDDMTEYVAYCK